MCVSRQFFFCIFNYWPNTGSIWFMLMAKRCLDGVATNWRDYLDYRYTDIRMYVVCVYGWKMNERQHMVLSTCRWVTSLFNSGILCCLCDVGERNATRFRPLFDYNWKICHFIHRINLSKICLFIRSGINTAFRHWYPFCRAVLCRAVPCRVVPINLLTDAEWLVCPLMWHTKSIAREKFAILMS